MLSLIITTNIIIFWNTKKKAPKVQETFGVEFQI